MTPLSTFQHVIESDGLIVEIVEVVSLKRCSRTTDYVYTQTFCLNIFTTESRFETQHRSSLMKLRCFNCHGRDLGAVSVVFDIALHMFSILTYFFVCRIFQSLSSLHLCISMNLFPLCFAQLVRLLPVLIGLVCLLSCSLLLAQLVAGTWCWDMILMFLLESISCNRTLSQRFSFRSFFLHSYLLYGLLFQLLLIVVLPCLYGLFSAAHFAHLTLCDTW